MADLVQSLGTVAVLVVVLIWILYQWRRVEPKHYNPGNLHKTLEEINLSLAAISKRVEDIWNKLNPY